MKKNMKIFMTGALLTSIMATAAIASDSITYNSPVPTVEGEEVANYDDQIMLIDMNYDDQIMLIDAGIGGELALTMPNVEENVFELTDVGVFVDGQGIENTLTITENERVLFPVRQVFEALGYTVEYVAESKSINLINGASFITFTIGEDAYAFARMAHQPLGSAPVLRDGLTYVPVEILELAGIESMVNRNTVNIFLNSEVSFEEVQTVTTNNLVEGASVVEIVGVDPIEGLVTVLDAELGEVVLTLTDEQMLELGGLDQKIQVIYSDRMTMSLPPMNAPDFVGVYTEVVSVVDVTVDVNEVVEELNITTAVITNIEEDAELGDTRITVNVELAGLEEMVLNIPSDYVVEFMTEATELEVGQVLEVELGAAMTMSLPPMNNPVYIKVIG